MANTTLSPNMNLPVPVVGVDPGPQYASDQNSCYTLIDQHNHSPGNGVAINPNGMNINSDLPINSNNLTLIRSVRFAPQSGVLANATDIGCLYEVGVDLYYNDGSGNNVRITQGGGVAGSPGSISNLTSPASASYVSADSVFVWQSAANTPANLDAASVILRNLSASSKGLTLSPPAAMAANYTLTLPSLPGATNIMSCDTSGNISANVNVDNTTLQFVGGTLAITTGGVSTAQIASQAVTQSKKSIRARNTTVGAGGICDSGGISTATTAATSFAELAGDVPLTITTLGNPVMIVIQPTATSSGLSITPAGFGFLSVWRNGVNHGLTVLVNSTIAAEINANFTFIDPVAAGTYTYKLFGQVNNGSNTLVLDSYEMFVFEL